MAIKNILVAYNGADSSKSAVKLARRMMEQYDAHLTGALTYVHNDLADVTGEVKKNHHDRIQQAFFDALGLPEGDKVHWVQSNGDVDYSLMEMARTYDIILVGQHDATRENRNLVPHPDVIALHSGRPVLVVPKSLPDSALNENAMLAWDGGKSAARALSDAMDILKTKTRVSVIAVGEGTAETLARLQSVTAHLATHGIKADADIVPQGGKSVGTVLLETAKEQGAGLLVMGAYDEHTKFFEDLWGGATNSAANTAEVPVLMSH